MKHLIYASLLALSLWGCIRNDSGDPDGPASAMDASGAETAMDEASAVGDNEGEEDCMPDEWWCLEEDMLPETPTRASEEDKGEADGDKEDKKIFNGWYGIDALLGYSLFRGETQVCDIRYQVLERTMVEDCEACAFAWAGTLSAPEVLVDDGPCEDAGNRMGEPIAYGHGAQAEEGFAALHVRDDESWITVENGISTYDETTWLYYITEEGLQGETPDGDSGETSVGRGGGKRLEAEIQTEEGIGTYGYVSVDRDGETVICEALYPVEAVTENSGCADCDSAWNIELGAVEISGDIEACAAYGLESNTTVSYGHSAPNQLHVNKGRWIAIPGDSDLEGTLWRFSVDLGQ